MRDTRNILARICDPLRVPGRQSWFFLQPYSMLDAYLTCSLMEAFEAAREQDKGEIHVILKRSHASIARLFDNQRLRITITEDQWMESLATDLRTVGLRSSLVPNQGIILHPEHLDDGQAEPLLQLRNCSRRNLYRYLLQLPLGSQVPRPAIPEVCRHEALTLAHSLDMPAGRGVILMPFDAGLDQIPFEAWASLASRLGENGYRVFTLTRDHTNGAHCPPLPGTVALDIGLEILLPLAEHAGWVVSAVNDTVRLLAEAQLDCRKTALSVDEGGSPWPDCSASDSTRRENAWQGLNPSDATLIHLKGHDYEKMVAAVLAVAADQSSTTASSLGQPHPNAAIAASGVGTQTGEAQFEHADGALALRALHEIQFLLSPSQRTAAAGAIARKVNETAPRFNRPSDPRAVNALHEQGIVDLGQVLSTAQTREVVDYFRGIPCYSAHVASYSDGVPRRVDQAASVGTYGSYLIDQSLRAPHLLELALNEELLNLCEHYLGCLPTLYSVHAWWTFAQSSEPGGTHSYHRDQDDHRFLSLFTYLTDVGPNDGPIDFLCGTHQPQQVDDRIAEYRRAHPQAPEVDANHFFPPMAGDGYVRGERKIAIPYEALFSEQRTTVVGQAGSAFLADTFALHRGNPPTAHHRLACWIRFGLAKSKTYDMDRTRRVPASILGGRVPRGIQMDWVTRLVVDHSC